VHQLSTSKTKIIITHPVCLNTARLAAKNYGLAESQLILIKEEGTLPGVPFLDQLIEFGASRPENFRAVRLKHGEAKTTVAFYCFSSGTSGETSRASVFLPNYADFFTASRKTEGIISILSMKMNILIDFYYQGRGNISLCSYRKCYTNGGSFSHL
jgi:hypothetical protein